MDLRIKTFGDDRRPMLVQDPLCKAGLWNFSVRISESVDRRNEYCLGLKQDLAILVSLSFF